MKEKNKNVNDLNKHAVFMLTYLTKTFNTIIHLVSE